MSYQFLCPRGHLLSADESAGGAQCKCPHCGMLFIIPPPPQDVFPAEPLAPPRPVAQDEEAVEAPLPPLWESDHTTALVDMQTRLGFHVPDDSAAPCGEIDTGPIDPLLMRASPDAMLQVVCPKGHRLQVPRQTLGEEVQCAVCQRRFQLTLKHTVEHLAQKAHQDALRQARLARLWLTWSITAAVVVLGALVALIAISKYR